MPQPSKKTFVGFGFGAIQGGLFLYEAYRSGNFSRLVVAEVLQEVVDAVRRSGGRYHLNVATAHGIERHEIRGVEIYNPLVDKDRAAFTAALADASEIATALPSVEFFDRGEASVAALLAGVLAKSSSPKIIYTAENNNHAAEILQKLCEKRLGHSVPSNVQFLNTVIGKMSGVVTDAEQIKSDRLDCVVEGLPRALLVEEFNRILITQIRLPGFKRGIGVFAEKPDLLPFEEAKLYGHNATHALMGYLAQRKGYRFMSEVANDPALMALNREAFLTESGGAMIARHKGLDPLFTPEGYQAYVDDLLVRMTNPYLRDQVERIIRDPQRKLGWDDRLVGTMRLELAAGIKPKRYALGAAAALEMMGLKNDIEQELRKLWPGAPSAEQARIVALIKDAYKKLVS
jgi:mannitol-1-phosphate 5-dehydrogenase